MKVKPGKEAPGNNYIVIVFDSCRYDSFVAAQPKNISKLGEVEARWSYASWTAPSHYNLLSGLVPHTSPKRVFASEFTSDHGELFGESGFFGHGPIMHKKVFEVPFVEGKLR